MIVYKNMSFQNVDSSQEICCICFTADNKPLIAHSDGSEEHYIHPLHKDCAFKWFEKTSICPTCRSPIFVPKKNFYEKLQSIWRKFFQTSSDLWVLRGILCFALGHVLKNRTISIMGLCTQIVFLQKTIKWEFDRIKRKEMYLEKIRGIPKKGIAKDIPGGKSSQKLPANISLLTYYRDAHGEIPKLEADIKVQKQALKILRLYQVLCGLEASRRARIISSVWY